MPDINEQTAVEEASEPGRRMDSELKIISAMLRLLGELNDCAAARVVAYLSSRFQSEKGA